MFKYSHILFIVLFMVSIAKGQSTITEQYNNGDIPTSLGAHDPNCNGPFTYIAINLPPGESIEVTSIDIGYNFQSLGGSNPTLQRSAIYFQNNGIGESPVAGANTTTNDYQSYFRSSVNIANGIYPGGTTLYFEMQAWRTIGGSGCNSAFQYIIDNSWSITVHYTIDTLAKIAVNHNMPLATFDVNGKIKIGDDVAAAEAGNIRWNEKAKDLQGFDGDYWHSLTGKNTLEVGTIGQQSGIISEYNMVESTKALIDSSAIIYDSGGEFGDYLDNESKLWDVRIPASMIDKVLGVYVHIDSLNILIEDTLQIGDMPSMSNVAMGNMGMFISNLVPDGANYKMSIKFNSNSIDTEWGFKLTYQIIYGTKLSFDSVNNPIASWKYNPSKNAIFGGIQFENSWEEDQLGKNSIQFGLNTEASGDNSFATGKSKATGEGAISMGQSTASGENSTASGQSTASKIGATALGNSRALEEYATASGQSTASGDYASSFGRSNAYSQDATAGGNSNAANIGATAFGSGSSSTNQYATALGRSNADGINALATGQSIASGNNASSLGFSNASGNNATAGGESIATKIGATAFGSYFNSTFNASATGDYASSFGRSRATGINTLATGRSIADGENASAFGYSNAPGFGATAGGKSTATKIGATAFGSYFDGTYASTATGDYSSSFGRSAASGNNGLATGQSTASGNNASALGFSNASGDNATAGGDSDATMRGSTAFGSGSNSTNEYATALGRSNASGIDATAGGQSTASGTGSTAFGKATASGNYSFAVGENAQALAVHSYALGKDAFVASDRVGSIALSDDWTFWPTEATQTQSFSSRSFSARFANGYRFSTGVDGGGNYIGVQLLGGETSWSSICDVNRKENFEAIDGKSFLNKLENIEFTSWNYKGQDPNKQRHYGIMAQDFYQAFGQDSYGIIGCDTLVNPIDLLGVAYAAIKELSLEIKASNVKIQSLQAENEALKAKALKLESKNENAKAELFQRIGALESNLEFLMSKLKKSE